MFQNYQYPIQDSYLEVTGVDTKTYYLFGSYDGFSHNTPKNRFKQEVDGQGALYPFIKVHTDKTRDSDSVYLNVYRIEKVATSETALALSADVKAAVQYLNDHTKEEDVTTFTTNANKVKSYYGQD